VQSPHPAPVPKALLLAARNCAALALLLGVLLPALLLPPIVYNRARQIMF
jgi:hypothetical protein